jgi:hypothetical protein
MFKTIAVCLILLYSINTAHANSEQWRKDLDDFSVKTCSARMNIARGLKGDIKRIKNYLPVITQAEKNQIEKELNDIDRLQGRLKKQKLAFLTMSTKSTLNELLKKLSDIIHNLDYIMFPRCDIFESTIWIAISNEIINSKDTVNYALHALAERNVIELPIKVQNQLRLDSTKNNCLWSDYIDTARMITQNIVTPLLLEELVEELGSLKGYK